MGNISITLCQEEALFHVLADTLTWVGHIHGKESPLVRVVIKDPWVQHIPNGTAKDLDNPDIAIPLGLWDFLAQRCTKNPTNREQLIHGKIQDPRWRNALLRAYQAQEGETSIIETPISLHGTKKVFDVISTEHGIYLYTRCWPSVIMMSKVVTTNILAI